MSAKNEEIIVAEYIEGQIIASETDQSREMYDKSRYGESLKNKYQYSLVEGLYLLERNKMKIKKGKKVLSYDDYLKLAQKKNKNFWIKYMAYKDMRNRGYIVKTALKFGADFRVYDRGIKPGEDHAKWVMYPISESDSCSWHEFAAKNRVAHSTRKRLLIAIVDDEGDCTYYSIAWTRP
ncbi:MAG: tRNA-intron lyase [Nanoarchaeota archaeon]|nr:tRNA-intron lyase [Nanoarchaeota archaeon]